VDADASVTASQASSARDRRELGLHQWRWHQGFDPLPVLFIAAGFALLLVPMYWNFALGVAADGMQGHEPAIFAVSALLLYRKRHDFLASPSDGAPVWGGLMLALGLMMYVFGRAYDLRISLVSLIVAMAAILLLFRGLGAWRVGWFALLFPLFALPLPFELVLAATGPLKIAVSEVATWLLSWAGYPVANSGVVMTIGQYQLLVTEACAGLQTMFTLEAMGLLYASLVNHPSTARNLLLAVLIVPIAFAANVLRVVVLALITYYLGDAAGQGFLHGLSGVVTFAAALVLVIATDALLGLFWTSGKR
jgi:exosortase B